jgi:hypothetical protein
MAVAKSYENMELMGQPFERNSKMYVKVKSKCPRCGGSGHYSYNQMDGTRCYGCGGSGIKVMEVRWYTDAQRASMDKAAEKRAAERVAKQEARRVKFAARNAFGFGEKGYITLIWGDNEEIKKWREDLPEHTVWYNNFFGWFIPSNREYEGLEIPENIKHEKFDWEKIRNKEDPENLEMIDNEEVKKIVQEIIYEPSKSEYQGEVGQWLEKDVKITKRLAFESNYGVSNMHIMEDADENVYIWNTSSKSLNENQTYHLKMKVKEHKDYQGTKQTVVWYCKVK